MAEWFQMVADSWHDAFRADDALKADVLVIRLLVAFALGGAVAAVYRFTYRSSEPATGSFMATLVLLAILISIVTQVIGDNSARAFSLVGALAIIRFRTVVQDTRDTAFVIFAVVIGMSVGAGFFYLSLIGFAVTAMAAIVMQLRNPAAIAGSDDWTLIVRLGLGKSEETLAPALRSHAEEIVLLTATTGRQGTALDLTYKIRLRASATATALVGELNRLEGVQNVDLRRV